MSARCPEQHLMPTGSRHQVLGVSTHHIWLLGPGRTVFSALLSSVSSQHALTQAGLTPSHPGPPWVQLDPLLRSLGSWFWAGLFLRGQPPLSWDPGIRR